MSRIFGLDIGTTSIGFAVIDHDADSAKGEIRRLGVRIFPEPRDPQGAPLNQERRQARLRRRQLRRRRERRRHVSTSLFRAGLLPSRHSPEWDALMKTDPYELRRQAFERKSLGPHEIGRAIYHLAQRRHFRRNEPDGIAAGPEHLAIGGNDRNTDSARMETARTLKSEEKTLGAWLADRGPHERKRGVLATREIIREEFDRIWLPLVPETSRSAVRDAIFFQKPIFWRLKTLGECPFVPGATLCPKGSWLSQQRRMLEKLNSLSLVGESQRYLYIEERQAVLSKLQRKTSMTWPAVRRALAPLYRACGEAGREKTLKFSLEEGGERNLPGNAVEAKLSKIFGRGWQDHPHKQEIRDSIALRLWQAEYEQVGDQRVTILPAAERVTRRAGVIQEISARYGLSDAQASMLETLNFPPGWEPFSDEALREILPHLEAGERFGEIVSSPEWEDWRNAAFSGRTRSASNAMDKLPSPAVPEESNRISGLRNPTAMRTHNQLRKVVNNLIDMFGKPDLIRISVARDVGRSKRQRAERQVVIRRQDRLRQDARDNLRKNGMPEPSRPDVDKWLLWEECGRVCPYTGDTISFDDLFRTGKFVVEPVWPLPRSLDDSYRNRTLCRKDVSTLKGNRTPYEFFRGNPGQWAAILDRISGNKSVRDGTRMPVGKVRRFLSASIPDDFPSRQFNDTSHTAREIVTCLEKLRSNHCPASPVRVHAVSGPLAAQMRRMWHLNNILGQGSEKTRADHRYHAIDALTVACCHPGMPQELSRFWQVKCDPGIQMHRLPLPWKSIRFDAERSVKDITVSHRVRRKVSGPLHKETVYGDTGKAIGDGSGTEIRYFVRRKPVETLRNSDAERLNGFRIMDIVDSRVRDIVRTWVGNHGGDPRTAFTNGYPTHGKGGPEIRKVRLHVKLQGNLMARASTGYAELGNNHHIAIYRLPNGKAEFEVVSLLEASRRLRKGKPAVNRRDGDEEEFLMSLSINDALVFSSTENNSIWIVKKISSNGQIYLRLHTDANKMGNFWAPSARTFSEKGAKKISVDPIGRIRPAND